MIGIGKGKAMTATGVGGDIAIAGQQRLLFVTVAIQSTCTCTVGSYTRIASNASAARSNGRRRMLLMGAFALINNHRWSAFSHACQLPLLLLFQIIIARCRWTPL